MSRDAEIRAEIERQRSPEEGDMVVTCVGCAARVLAVWGDRLYVIFQGAAEAVVIPQRAIKKAKR